MRLHDPIFEALPYKSVVNLEEVSTTCDSGWVRSPHAGGTNLFHQ